MDSRQRQTDIALIAEYTEMYVYLTRWGTAAAAPSPFRLGHPALCGNRPLVTHSIIVD